MSRPKKYKPTRYLGVRDPHGSPHVFVIRGDRSPMPLDPRFDLVNHSPDGFNWGYGGSGPSQLAAALLADVQGDIYDPISYVDFKASIISRLPLEVPAKTGQWRIEWILSGAAVRNLLFAMANPAHVESAPLVETILRQAAASAEAVGTSGLRKIFRDGIPMNNRPSPRPRLSYALGG